MTKAKNRVTDFMADLKAGMSDAALQDKYELSSKKFALYKEMTLDIITRNQAQKPKIKRKINAHELLADLKSGMNDDFLMTKYDLTPLGLQSAFRKIVKAGMASALDISRRLNSTEARIKETFIERDKAIDELD